MVMLCIATIFTATKVGNIYKEVAIICMLKGNIFNIYLFVMNSL